MDLIWLLSILLMLVGFGFVIFWHELGHFLGARWAGVRVEQFAVGMGHALVSFRKGLGLRVGSSQKAYDERVYAELHRRGQAGELSVREKDDIAKSIGLGETEYRLSMLPIGGYVKPTGQDDLRPAAEAAGDDPHSYAAAPVGKRMVIISAGVIMNVILAAILFFVLFRFIGFRAIQPVVGEVQSGSPAAAAGLRAGDVLLELDGRTLHDFTKVVMNTALLPDDESVGLKIRRDGVEQTLSLQGRISQANHGMVTLGIGPMNTLTGRPEKDFEEGTLDKLSPEQKLVLPGETIVAIDGRAVESTDGRVLHEAIQQSFGRPVRLTIRGVDGKTTREASFVPPFAGMFNGERFEMLGMSPRTRIVSLQKDSSAAGKLEAGDLILKMQREGGQPLVLPSTATFITATRLAGENDQALSFVVERDGQRLEISGVRATTKIKEAKTRGLGAMLEPDLTTLVVADLDHGSSLAKAGILPGARIVAVDGTAVSSWFDLHRALLAAGDERPISITVQDADGSNERSIDVRPTRTELAALRQIRYANPIETLDDLKFRRETDSTLTALGWGASETRDMILQGYLMLKRVVYNRTVPAKNLSGPVGIFHAGTRFAYRGADSFIWFLAVISANLAVVNFLPIPILDGWHFLGLLKEKLTGKPVSERVQVVAQYVGLAMILTLIVFVTYHDILRF